MAKTRYLRAKVSTQSQFKFYNWHHLLIFIWLFTRLFDFDFPSRIDSRDLWIKDFFFLPYFICVLTRKSFSTIWIRISVGLPTFLPFSNKKFTFNEFSFAYMPASKSDRNSMRIYGQYNARYHIMIILCEEPQNGNEKPPSLRRKLAHGRKWNCERRNEKNLYKKVEVRSCWIVNIKFPRQHEERH